MKTSKHPKLANGQPAISCFTISLDEVIRRENLAYERARAQALAEQADEEDAQAIARMTLWHTEFSVGLMLYICDNALYRVAADLPSELLIANGNKELDFYDYGYVADVLRELLTATRPSKGDKRNLRRALAWVEGQGSRLHHHGLE